MAFTTTFAVDNTAFVNITVNSYCRKILVFENDLAGSADYLAQSPAGAVAVTQPAGTTFVFEAVAGTFAPGTIVGAIKAVAGSMTFAQVEQ